MTIFEWLKSKLSAGTLSLTSDPAADLAEFWSMAASLHVRELAFRTCVNLLAKAVSKCEFKTYEAGKEKRGEVWYSWNIRPNRNQCSTVFINKLITKLMENNEALIIQTTTNEMLVADNYTKEVFAVRDYRFTGVTVDDYTFQKPFMMPDVLFFQLNNEDIRRYVNGLQASYGQLLEYAQKAFKKSRGQKGILSINAKKSGEAGFEDSLKRMMNERFKPYFDADSAVLPMTDGYEYSEKESKTYSSDTTRDIRAQVDDIFVFTARAFSIQPALILGNVADTSKAVDSLLTFAVDPLTDLLSEEINGKTYGKKVLQGNKLVIDTKAIKHVDLLAVASNIDKLISSGAWCINDIRTTVGDEPIDEPWARQHWMTKNYSTMADSTNGLSTGDSNG